MSDMIDMYRDLKQHRREQKERYARGALDAMAKLQHVCPYAEVRLMDPGHYHVDDYFDWWPSTGRWLRPGTTIGGRGVDGLIKAIVKRRSATCAATSDVVE